MQNKDDAKSTFTTIYHDILIELKLSALEYMLLDTVYRLSQNDKGYCYKSIRSFARDLGMSPEGVRGAIYRLVKGGQLLPHRKGYKACDEFIEKVRLKTDRKTVTNRLTVRKTDTYRSTDRNIGMGVRKSDTSVRKISSQQMLYIQDNKNINTHGSLRVIPREPQQAQPLSASALRLQKRLEQIRSKGAGNNQTSAK